MVEGLTFTHCLVTKYLINGYENENDKLMHKENTQFFFKQIFVMDYKVIKFKLAFLKI